jgi:hypothetical protein
MLLCLVGCSGCGQRPVEVGQADAFKREVLAQALQDKRVRDQAYRQAVYEREFARAQESLDVTLAQANNVEVAENGVAYIRGKDASGKEVREPVGDFVKRAIALADANRQKIATAVEAETAADEVVNAKLRAALQLDIAIEKYRQAAEKGTTPQDLDKIMQDLVKAIKPLLKE